MNKFAIPVSNFEFWLAFGWGDSFDGWTMGAAQSSHLGLNLIESRITMKIIIKCHLAASQVSAPKDYIWQLGMCALCAFDIFLNKNITPSPTLSLGVHTHSSYTHTHTHICRSPESRNPEPSDIRAGCKMVWECKSSCVAFENEKWSKWVFGSKTKKTAAPVAAGPLSAVFSRSVPCPDVLWDGGDVTGDIIRW